jgi:hypothetical protein
MLVSFSEPEMLPYVRAGIRQALGEDVGDERVKRQTIRRYGERARRLLAHDAIGGSIPYDLDLFWKSRTPESDRLGKIPCRLVRVFRIEILHSFVRPPGGPEYQCIRIVGRPGWRDGDAMLFWSPGNEPNGFCDVAFNDGFDSPEAFRDYFVPDRFARFEAILYRW